MIFKNFSFCILKNPFSTNSSDVIFITIDNQKDMLKDIIESEPYSALVDTLRTKYNMVQLDWFAFTYSNNTPDNYLNIKKELESSCGMKYDKNLEKNMEGYFSDLEHELKMNNSIYIKQSTFDVKEVKDIVLINKKDEYVPQLGEKVTLFLYLFIKANFIDNYCYLEFTGDFFSKEDHNNKNFVKVYKCDFIRIDEREGEGMILQSTKTFKEILHEIPIDFHGSFETRHTVLPEDSYSYDFKVPKFKTFKYEYNFFDIYKSLSKDIKIIISNQENRYRHLVELSDNIKKDYKIAQAEQLNIKKIRKSINYVKSNITNKMLKLSENEMYEDAAECKKNIDKLENLDLKLSKKKKKTILRKEYEKISCLLN